MVNTINIIDSHQGGFSFPACFNIYMVSTYSYEKQQIKLFLSKCFLIDKMS